MANYLVIVESPAKVKTIKKFLGANYEVAASNGHVRDLPKSSLGIDVDGDFEPKYITIRGKGDVLANLNLGYACLYAGYYSDCDMLLSQIAALGEGQADVIRLDLEAQERSGLSSPHTAALLALLP